METDTASMNRAYKASTLMKREGSKFVNDGQQKKANNDLGPRSQHKSRFGLVGLSFAKSERQTHARFLFIQTKTHEKPVQRVSYQIHCAQYVTKHRCICSDLGKGLKKLGVIRSDKKHGCLSDCEEYKLHSQLFPWSALLPGNRPFGLRC